MTVFRRNVVVIVFQGAAAAVISDIVLINQFPGVEEPWAKLSYSIFADVRAVSRRSLLRIWIFMASSLEDLLFCLHKHALHSPFFSTFSSARCSHSDPLGQQQQHK